MKSLKVLSVAAVAGVAVSLSLSAGASGAVERYKAMLNNSASSDFVCNDSYADRVNERIATLVPNVCAQLDTEPSLDGHPFAYDNPQASCDLGAGMVGMPSWNGVDFDVTGVDACNVAKM